MTQAQNILPADPLQPNNPLPERTPEMSPQKKKSKRNLYISGIFGGISILLLISATFLYFYERNQNQSIAPTPTTLPTTTDVTEESELGDELVVSPTVVKAYPKATVADKNFNTSEKLGPLSDDAEFEVNGVYYAKDNGKDAIYIHFQNSNGIYPQLYYHENEAIRGISDFDAQNELSQRTLVFLGKQPYDDPSLTDFSIDPDGKYLDFGLVSHSATNTDSYPDTSNVFRYNFDSEETEILIQKKLFNESFLDYSGAFYVEQTLSKDYTVLYITQCYACGGAGMQSFVLNTKTSEYLKLADEIGDIEYSESNNTVTYKKNLIVGQQEDCLDYCPIFELSDEIFTTELP